MVEHVIDIERETRANEDYRRVLFTGRNLQLVLMTIRAGEEIGAEIHDEHDQFIRVESGSGMVMLDGQEYSVNHGVAVIIPAGVEHNVVNTSSTEALHLYTLYSPPEHGHRVIHRTKAEERKGH
jgi:mannose-6-phosphate isomerase-like protein (cupin superfamily)